MFIGRTDAEAETPILWPPDAKRWLIWKDPDAGKDWRQEKGTTKDKMVGWHHWLNGHGFGWTPGVGDGQGGLMCCDSWGCKELDMNWATELNWTEDICRTGLRQNYVTGKIQQHSVAFLCFKQSLHWMFLVSDFLYLHSDPQFFLILSLCLKILVSTQPKDFLLVLMIPVISYTTILFCFW